MANILIICSDQAQIDICCFALANHHEISAQDHLLNTEHAHLIILHAALIEVDRQLMMKFIEDTQCNVLIIGQQWSEDKQVDAVLRSASGYFDMSESAVLLQKAVERILVGDIWLQRALIPQVIKSVSRHKPQHTNEEQHQAQALLDTLSKREKDVAAMIASGKSNKRIANQLNISERTVKAHLTSIFRKLNVADRLHLAVFIKECS